MGTVHPFCLEVKNQSNTDHTFRGYLNPVISLIKKALSVANKGGGYSVAISYKTSPINFTSSEIEPDYEVTIAIQGGQDGEVTLQLSKKGDAFFIREVRFGAFECLG